MPKLKKQLSSLRVLRTTGFILPAAVLIIIGLGGYAVWANKNAGASYICVPIAFTGNCDSNNSGTYAINNMTNTVTNKLADNDMHTFAYSQAVAQPFSVISYNFIQGRSATRISGIQFNYYGATPLDSQATVELRTFNHANPAQSGTLIASSDASAITATTSSVQLLTFGSATAGSSAGAQAVVSATLAKPLDLADGAYALVFIPKPFQTLRLGSAAIQDGRVSAEYYSNSGWKNYGDRSVVASLALTPFAQADFFPNNTYTLGLKTITQLNAVQNQLVATKSTATDPVFNFVGTRFTYKAGQDVSGISIALAGQTIDVPQTLQARIYLQGAKDTNPNQGTQIWGGNITLSASKSTTNRAFYTLSTPSYVTQGYKVGQIYSIILNEVGSKTPTEIVMQTPTLPAGSTPSNFFIKDSSDERSFTWQAAPTIKNPITIGLSQ